MLKGEFAVGRLDVFERAGLLQPKVHEVHMDGDGKAAHPEHLRKKFCLVTLLFQFGDKGLELLLLPSEFSLELFHFAISLFFASSIMWLLPSDR
jgi:hypothetical protein